MNIIACQPAPRPALPAVYGPLDYREQRALFERMDRILSQSGLDHEFLAVACADQGLDLSSRLAKQNRAINIAGVERPDRSNPR